MVTISIVIFVMIIVTRITVMVNYYNDNRYRINKDKCSSIIAASNIDYDSENRKKNNVEDKTNLMKMIIIVIGFDIVGNQFINLSKSNGILIITLTIPIMIMAKVIMMKNNLDNISRMYNIINYNLRSDCNDTVDFTYIGKRR